MKRLILQGLSCPSITTRTTRTAARPERRHDRTTRPTRTAARPERRPNPNGPNCGTTRTAARLNGGTTRTTARPAQPERTERPERRPNPNDPNGGTTRTTRTTPDRPGRPALSCIVSSVVCCHACRALSCLSCIVVQFSAGETLLRGAEGCTTARHARHFHLARTKTLPSQRPRPTSTSRCKSSLAGSTV